MRNRQIPDISPEDMAYAHSLVVYEDADILVLDKPSGLAVQGGRGISRSVDSLLAAFAKSNGKTPRLVHRLDRGTSGILLIARTKPAAAFLSEQFSGRQVLKTYLALVEGALPQKNEGVFDQALLRFEQGARSLMRVADHREKDAQSARTQWKILARQSRFGLIQLKPETGRMHQIRVHLSQAGCPILGDDLYGDGKASAARLMLHAEVLEITHPQGERRVFLSAVNDDFQKQVGSLGLQSGL